jgi:hypothetical protein
MSSQITEEVALPARVEEIYDSAVDEHPEFLTRCVEDELRRFIGEEILRIDVFEDVAREPLVVSREVADDIGAIKIHSGVGSYDEPFKPEDNPRLLDIGWMQWFDRRRIDHGVRLARKIAEARSGYVIRDQSFSNIADQREETKRLIAEYGPYLIYNGYPVETAKAEDVLARSGGIIPKEKAIIIHGNPKNTVEAARAMEFPDYAVEGGKQIAIVTHAPHLARVLHIMGEYPFLPEGSVPYIAPLPTPETGRTEFALMEIRGMLNYIFLDHDASKDAHQYQTLR